MHKLVVLKQWRKEIQHLSEQAAIPGNGKIVLHRHFLTVFQSVLEISLYLRDHRIPVNISGTFKMMVKASEIEIDGAHHSFIVIGYDCFRMDKTRGIFVNLHPRPQEHRIGYPCHIKDHFFIRNMRHDQFYLRSPLARMVSLSVIK